MYLRAAFLRPDNLDLVNMVQRGKMTELLSMIKKRTYRKLVTFKNQVKFILYVELTKSVYLILWSALIFYMKVWRDMKQKCF